MMQYTIRITERRGDDCFVPVIYNRQYLSDKADDALDQCVRAVEREHEQQGYVTASKEEGDPTRLVMMKGSDRIILCIERVGLRFMRDWAKEPKQPLKKRVGVDIAILGFGLLTFLAICWVGLDMHLPVHATGRCFIRDGVHTAAYVLEETEQETVAPVYETAAPAPETTAPETVPTPETAAPAPTAETVNAETDEINAEIDTQRVEAAGNALNLSEYDEYLLLNIMMHEAGNQGPIGCALVGRCVINRMQDPAGRFGNTIEAVLTQPHQFGPLSEICRYTPNADCYTALEMLESGWDESQGALFFESGAGFSWATFLFQYGGHRFYTA